MTLTCHAVVVRSQAVDAALPWPHWRGAPPSDERRADFVAPSDDPTHPFRVGEYHRHIRLHGDLDDLELGTVIAALCLYNDVAHEPPENDDDDGEQPLSRDPAAILARLLAEESIIVAGGLELHLDDREILAPQCCCGLETWRAWFAFADGGDPPWSGHSSPDPHLERLPSGLLEIGHDAIHLVDPADLRAALDETSRTLAAFTDRLATWLATLVPSLAPALTRKLAEDLALR